jgi:DNA mismatch repair protein MutS
VGARKYARASHERASAAQHTGNAGMRAPTRSAIRQICYNNGPTRAKAITIAMAEFSLNNLTPMMRQYFEVKEQKPGIILLMRVGDFYEAYGEDAKTIARDLDITLTGREDKMAGERIPMAGVPHHAVERYMARLLAKGHKVALCDQVEDPKLAKGLVKRKVTRIVTPGTVMEDALLDAKRNNFLVAAITAERLPSGIGVLDVSTGEFLTGEIERADSVAADIDPNQRLVDEIARLQPAECLIRPEMEEELAEPIRAATGAAVTVHDFRDQRKSTRQQLLDHFGTQSLRGFGCEELTAGLDAAALLLDYVRQTHASALPHIRTLGVYSSEGYMLLDAATRRNLELTQAQMDGSRAKSLLHLLDRTITPQGGRMLRRWLEQPLLDVGRIVERQDGVADFARDGVLRGDARDALRGISDLERLAARICAGMASARDLVALRSSLASIAALGLALERARPDSVLGPLRERLTGAPPDLIELLDRAIEDDPPLSLREGALIRRGYSDELDSLRELRSGGKAFIAAIEDEERARTGIKTLKVGYNNVFGYYIEAGKSYSAQIPGDYIRKQTTVNSERYITPALKEREAQVLGAEERIVELEYDIFVRIRAQIADRHSSLLVSLGRAVAQCDVLAALAEVASSNGYVRPTVLGESSVIELRAARHPVVEQLQSGTMFVPNDSYLDDAEQRLHIITGPNAAGKSTYLRQVAICVLLAQIGSFIPAAEATIGLVDRIFTRVGAQDDLATGQSTFMVEMSETANILNNATARSLIILDEVGRGTSTYDGLALAWSIAEYLHAIGAKTLFATHYHQLNELEKMLPGAKNFRITVKEQGHHIVWLRKIVPGGTDKSYGIQVARLAGLPDTVLIRAGDILKSLEANHRNGSGSAKGAELASRTKKLQLTLFETERHPVVDEIDALDLGTISPIEALTKLYELQKKVKATPA